MSGTAADISYWHGADSGNEGDLGTAANFLTDSGSPGSPPEAGETLRFDRRAAYQVNGSADFASTTFAAIVFDSFRFPFGSSSTPVEIDAASLVVDTLQDAYLDGTFVDVEVRNTALKEKAAYFDDGDVANLKVLAGGAVVVGAACELSKDAGERTVVQGGRLVLEANASPVAMLIAYAGASVQTARDVTLLVTDGTATFTGSGKATTTVLMPGGRLDLRGSGQFGVVVALNGTVVSDRENASTASITTLVSDMHRSVIDLKSKTASVTNDDEVGLPAGGLLR